MENGATVVGSSVQRREDDRLLRGKGRFVADLRPGALHAAFVRSTAASADITEIAVDAARTMPGVVEVLTGAELAADTGPMPVLTVPDPRFVDVFSLRSQEPDIRCMAVDRVRYVGEPVAVVVAEDRYLAEDAAEAIVVGYEPRPAVLEVDDALADDAEQLHERCPGNVGIQLEYRKGVVPADSSDVVVVEGEYRIGRHSGVPIEGRGVLATPGPSGEMEVWTSTQIPFLVRRAICLATGWPEEDVRVRTPDVGGGFGPKANVYGEEIVVPILARRLETAVAWVEDRQEHLTSAAQSRDQRHRTRLTVDRNGHILAWEDDFDVNLGAHNFWMAGVTANTAIHLLGAYRMPACRVTGRAVFTNKAPSSQYRGAGRPEAAFALERSLDRAARLLGVSGLKLREQNILTADDLPYPQGLPYRDGVDIVYDGRDYRAALRACDDLLPDREVEELRQAEREAGRLVGVGIATYVEATGRGPFESGRVALNPSGRFTVHVGTASAGQGHETSLAQIAADVLGVDIEAVQVRSGDTEGVPHALGSFASRTAVVAGSAVREAAQQVRARARKAVTTVHGVNEDAVHSVPGGFVVEPGGDATVEVSWEEVAGWFGPRGRLAREGPVDVVARFEPRTVTWTMGAHLAVVSVDPATGLVRVLRYAVADEGGAMINPAIVEGQVKGGVAQGIGGALLEEFRYDATGQPTSTTLAEYLLPGTGEVPPVRVAHLDAPSMTNDLGLKGVGESGTIPGCAVIAAAVDDALADRQVHVTATPIHARDVRTWLRAEGL